MEHIQLYLGRAGELFLFGKTFWGKKITERTFFQIGKHCYGSSSLPGNGHICPNQHRGFAWALRWAHSIRKSDSREGTWQLLVPKPLWQLSSHQHRLLPPLSSCSWHHWAEPRPSEAAPTSPATAAAGWHHTWPKGPRHLPMPRQERGTFQVTHSQIQPWRLPQTFCSQLGLHKTPSNRATKLPHNADPLCIDVFVIVLHLCHHSMCLPSSKSSN